MIESLQTPVSMKLQLIPVLRHMHHDANTAAMVKDLCLNLLPKYPLESFVIAILDSLTKLSSQTLIGIPDQVIQHYGKCPSLFRSVDSVQLSLTSQLMTPRVNTECIKPSSDTVTLTQVVKPQRDFLSGSFLLPISIGGQWNVTLETFVIDEVGITWSTGPKSSMIVRVLEDPNKPQPASASTSSIPARRF